LGYMYKRKKDFEAGVKKETAAKEYEKSKNYGNEGRGKKMPDTTGTSKEGMEKYALRRQTSQLSKPQTGDTETQENRAAQMSFDRANAGREGYDEGGDPIKTDMKRGGSVKKMASGGKTSSASNRADGIAQRGKTKGRMC